MILVMVILRLKRRSWRRLRLKGYIVYRRLRIGIIRIIVLSGYLVSVFRKVAVYGEVSKGRLSYTKIEVCIII